MAIATYLKGLVSGGDGASSAEGEKAAGSEGTEEKVSEKKEPVKPSAPKPALPVRPVALSAKGLQSYCGQGSLKIRQQQPLCVISFRKGASMDALHKKLEDSGPSCFWMAPARILGITSRTRSNGARTWRALAMMSTRATWCCCERSVSLLPRCWFCRLRRMRASRRH
jgi:hypothetical protein